MSWFQINASAQADAVDVLLYGDIGWDVTAQSFLETLAAAVDGKASLNLRVNSLGGSVMEGLAIYEGIKRLPIAKTTWIDGIAASMASVIALACDTVNMARAGQYMIHNARGIQSGEADAMRKTAALMDSISASMAQIYADKSKKPLAEIQAAMRAETWFNAQDAKDFGLIDNIVDGGVIVASATDFEKHGFVNVPHQIFAKAENNAEKPAINNPARAVNTNGAIDMPNTQASASATALNDAVVDVTTITNTARDTERKEQTKRVNAIKAVFATFPDHKDLMVEMISDVGADENTARAKLLEALGRNTQPAGQPARIEMGEDARDKFKAAASAVIEAKAGIGKHNLSQNEFASFSLMEMARHSLRLSGQPVMGDKMAIVAAAMATSGDFQYLLANTANKAMLRGFELSGESWDKIARKGNLTDFKVTDRVGMSGFTSLDAIKDLGEYTSGKFVDQREQIQLGTYGKKFSISRQAIINDDLSAFTTIPAKMGAAANRKVGDVVWAVITANAAMADGTALFHANHGNLVASGAGAAPSVTTVGALRTKMRLQTGRNSEPISVEPSLILAPVEMADALAVLMASEYDPLITANNSRSPNAVRNAATVVTDRRLSTSSATKWYMSANPEIYDTIEVAFLDGNASPFLEQQNGWDVDGVEFKVRIDCAAKALDWPGLAHNFGS